MLAFIIILVKVLGRFDAELSASSVAVTFTSLQDQYHFFHHSFWNRVPDFVRNIDAISERAEVLAKTLSRDVVSLAQEYRPENLLEIGVYRGQVISLWALIARELGSNAIFTE